MTKTHRAEDGAASAQAVQAVGHRRRCSSTQATLSGRRYYPRPYDRGRAEYVVAQAVLTSWDKGAAFAVEHDGRVIGLISLTVDPEDRKAELGYDIARGHVGAGGGPGSGVGRLRLGVPRVRDRQHLRACGRPEQALLARDGKAGYGARRDISKR